MKLKPCISLSFNGQCEAAFQFYQRCLGGQIGVFLTWGDSPKAQDAPPEWHGKILHASFTIGDLVFAGADALPHQYAPPRGFAVLLNLSDRADAERIFKELADRGAVNIPLQETFWALRFGGVTDQFGIPWQINCERPE